MKYYMNAETGELTTEHKTAVEWYRNGAEVVIFLNGEERLRWIH